MKNFHNYSCLNENCVEEETQEIIETCDFICLEGVCTGQCSQDSDCGTQTSQILCDNNKVVNETITPTCENNTCKNITSRVIIETCETNENCENNKCVEKEKKKSRSSSKKYKGYEESIKTPSITIGKIKSFENFSSPETIDLGSSKNTGLKKTSPDEKNYVFFLALIVLTVLIVLLIIIIIIAALHKPVKRG
jgi:hypothetical protein